jgi:homoserine O-acetyltransferase
MLNTWAAPIVSDPNWNGGDYYGRAEPVNGVAGALKLAVLAARHPGWADKTFGRKWAAADKNPLQDWGNQYAIEGALDMISHGRAIASDANAFLYLLRAIQLYQVEGVAGIQAKVLATPSKSDLTFYPDYTRKMVATLKAQGTHVEVFEIDGDGGHLDGILDPAKAGEAIRAFLKK